MISAQATYEVIKEYGCSTHLSREGEAGSGIWAVLIRSSLLNHDYYPLSISASSSWYTWHHLRAFAETDALIRLSGW